MARQPFLPTYAGVPTRMAPSLIDSMPKVAELVGRCAINWSGVELQLALALGSMLGVGNPASVAVFLSLRNHRAQRDALRAAADKSLSGGLKDLFDAILRVHASLDSQRNDVVHCVWGAAEGTPDGVIWSSLQDHANMLITSYHNETTGALDGYEEVTRHMTKDYFVYRFSDLELLNSQITALATAVSNFHVHLRYRHEPAGASALKLLRDEPLIQEALNQIRGT